MEAVRGRRACLCGVNGDRWTRNSIHRSRRGYVVCGASKKNVPSRVVIFDDGQDLKEVSKSTGIELERLVRANRGAEDVKGQKLIVLDEEQRSSEQMPSGSERVLPITETRQIATREVQNQITPVLSRQGIAFSKIFGWTALGIFAFYRIRRLMRSKKSGEAEEAYSRFMMEAGIPGTTTTAQNTEIAEIKSYDVEDLQHVSMDWWKELPYVCVVLMSADEGGGQWFAVDMSDGDRPLNHIVGFANAEDANRFQWNFSNDKDYRGRYPRVQMMSPSDLEDASLSLDMDVYVLRDRQLAPVAGTSGSVMAKQVYDTFFEEVNFGIQGRSAKQK